MGDAPHLWEVDHPYYASEGNYYRNGEHYENASWADFMETGGGRSDLDYNLLYRWDWKCDDATGYGDNWTPGAGPGTLWLYFMAQRNARAFSQSVVVAPDDEPAVVAWLAERWAHLQQVWAPFAAAEVDLEGLAREVRRQRITKLRAELAALEVNDAV